jgi:hypothetical protein
MPQPRVGSDSKQPNTPWSRGGHTPGGTGQKLRGAHLTMGTGIFPLEPGWLVRGPRYPLVVANRSREEVIQKLAEQVGLLRSSARAFDEGIDAEALRMAVHIRVLVHHTKRSRSLLNQLGVQHQLLFLDTWQPPEPSQPGHIIVHRWDAGLAVIEFHMEEGKGEARFRAPLNDQPDRITGPQPFRFWWNQAVIEDVTRQRFTRKDLVLFMANQEGGAHIDPEIKPRWHALTRLNSLGWGYRENYITVPAGPDDSPMGNPVPANIRQIAFEVEKSIAEQLRDLLDRGSAA